MAGSGAREMPFAEFLREEWLPATRATVRPTTFANYTSHVESQIIPHLGDRKLGDLDGRTLNGFYAALLDHGRVDGKGGLARSSVRRIHACLHKALKDAVRWGFLSENPVDAADPPALRAEGPKEMATWTAKELGSFLRFVQHDPLYPLWFLLATTGLRRGEALGLRWVDVDLEAGHIVIRQCLVPVNGTAQFSIPKTNRGRRVVAIDKRTRALMASLRGRSTGHDPTALVFGSYCPTALSPTAVTKRFRILAEGSGVPLIRLHDLRHTHATLALEAGVHPKIVSERLGHSTVSLTLDVYSHAVPHMQKEAAEQIASVMFD